MTTVFKNLSEKEYNEIPALRSSIITTIDRQTMAHAKAQIDGAYKPTASQKLGIDAHCYLLTKEKFEKEYGVFSEGYNGSTKEGKAEKAALLEKYQPENLIKYEALQEIKAWEKSILADPFTKALYEGIYETELTIVWEEDGILCKARIDALSKVNGQIIPLDFKTASSASEDEFTRSLVKWQYPIQAFHYLEGLKKSGIIENNNNNFCHLVLEKSAPYLVAPYVIDDGSLDLASVRRYHSMKKYALAMSTGSWPGYPSGISTIAYPHWYIQQQQDTQQVTTFN